LEQCRHGLGWSVADAIPKETSRVLDQCHTLTLRVALQPLERSLSVNAESLDENLIRSVEDFPFPESSLDLPPRSLISSVNASRRSRC
jgi:hypothetical protein